MKEISIGRRSFVIHSLGGGDEYEPVIRDGFGDDLWRFAAAQLGPDSVVLDVGANIGLTSCLFAQLAASVHAVEPNPAVYELLAANLMANGLANVHPHRLAIGDTGGTMHFTGKSAFGRLTSDTTELSVDVRTVDDMVDQLQLIRLDLLKIDVEGFEPNVLRGAARTLERFNPIIVMEFNAWTLLAHGDVNPLGFARELLRDHAAVHFLPRASVASARITDPLGLAYINIIEHRCVSDLVLLKRERPMVPALPPRGVAAPRQPVQVKRRDAHEPPSEPSAMELQKQLDAVYRSKSWKITAPLRALRRLWR
jgi:FkbM family methyltransferase